MGFRGGFLPLNVYICQVLQANALLLKSIKRLVDTIITANGDVAQLARALDWQSRGRRFESDLLHNKKQHFRMLLFYVKSSS